MIALRWNILFVLSQFLKLKGVQATELFYISKTTWTWIDAARSCTLWTPTILEYDTRSVDIVQEYINEPLWVGYHLAKANFKYLGCGQTDFGPSRSYNGTGLQRCYAACGYTLYIGISTAGCFCGDPKSAKRLQYLKCDGTCTGCMELYQVHLEGEVNGTTAPKDAMCTCPDRLPHSSVLSSNWIETRNVIVKFNGRLNITTPAYGYVNKTADGHVQLEFEMHLVRLRALCTRASSTTTEDPAEHNQGVFIGVSVAAAVFVIAIVVLLVTLKRRRKCPNLRRETVPTKDSNNTRSMSIVYKTMIHESQVNPVHGVINEPCSTDVREQDNIINESRNYSVIDGTRQLENQNAHDYFNFEKSAREVDQNVENVNLHNYFKLEEHSQECNHATTAYDTTRTRESQMAKETDNVYNALNENDSTLDENIYNTTKKDEHRRDATYDTTERALYKVKYADNRNGVNTDTDVDTYHHTGDKPLNCIRSDNIYGTPGHLKVSEGDYQQRGTINQDDLDTYSHLNINLTNIARTDNLYGLHKEIYSTRNNSEEDYDVTGNVKKPATTDNTYSKLETNY